jgi:1-acyl-sn-glycerol-3-phosphate acyltransferase
MRVGPALRLTIFLVKPFLLLVTKREWRGVENLHLDDGGIVLAANHMSWIDPLLISHVLVNNGRPPRFLAKEAIFRVPFIGWIVTDAGQIPVYRESADAAKSIRDAVAAVESGECVIVYPEGTLTRDPDLWPMSAKSGAVRIALMSGRPLVPLAHWGAQHIMRPYKKELRIIPRKRIEIRIGTPIDLSDLPTGDLSPETMRIGTERLMDAITALLAEIRQEQPPATRFIWKRTSKGEQ